MKRTKTVRLDAELLEQVKDEAGARDFSEVVREALGEWLDARGPVQPVIQKGEDVIQHRPVPAVPGVVRATELPGRCSFHGCHKRGVRKFGEGWRCEDH